MLKKRRFEALRAWAILIAAQLGIAACQQLSAQDDPDQIQKWFAFYDAEAASYELSIAGDPPTRLQLKPTPISRYTNPVRTGQQHGAVYVWTHDGRPQAISSVWSSVPKQSPDKRSIAHEFQSLSQQKLISSHARQVGRKGVVPDWNPAAGGITFHPLPKAAAPAAKETTRLSQMRQISRRFAAAIKNSRDEVDRNLRLKTQPVYRYRSKSAGVTDGAIFSFAIGTDPEVVLLVEATKDEGESRWQYAVARMTNSPLSVTLDGETVWECPPAEPYVGRNPYFIYWGVSVHDQLR